MRKSHFVIAVARAMALGAIALGTAAHAADKTEVLRVERPRAPQTVYKIEAGLDGEIFPVFANYASLQKPEKRKAGVVTVSITNPTENLLRNHITVEVPGWSDREIQIAEVAAGQTRTFIFAPTFLPRFFRNTEIVAATASIVIATMAGETVHTSTAQVRLRSAEDMYWGARFKYAPFIASWITPHDANVETVLARAKESLPGRRLPGYEPWKSETRQEASTVAQARAIYNAIQKRGVSYVKSSLTFGENVNVSQRVRRPHVSLEQNSANCIDAVVLLASAFENLGMEPMVVVVPGHAYVGVRVAQNSSKFLYMDVALIGRAKFDAAVSSANKGLAKHRASEVTKVYVSEARQAGIFPMP